MSVNFCNDEKKISTDYPHWQITHTFCLHCFIENDTTCKNLANPKKIDISRSTESQKSLEMGKINTL